MEITANTTGMLADVCVARDREAHEYCVVVVKGTFDTDDQGQMTLADEQRALVYADEHYGEPESSCVRHESDFAAEKTRTDVLVVAEAVAPEGKPVEELQVRLEVQGHSKDVLVVGHRRWKLGPLGLTSSRPEPFATMPLTFEHAFGGQDDTRGELDVAVERRNPAGVGFSPRRPMESMIGLPLPNLERPTERIRGPRDKPEPIGLGCIGRGWTPRLDHAGTYDDRWLEDVCPFLPPDFDPRYFQCAPLDQQFPMFRGGELLRCVHMSTAAVVSYRLPTLPMPIRFLFVERGIEQHARLDTVVLLPGEGQAMLTWRARARLPKKWNRLRGVLVGEQPAPPDDGIIGYVRGKPRFRGLQFAIRWLKRRAEERE